MAQSETQSIFCQNFYSAENTVVPKFGLYVYLLKNVHSNQSGDPGLPDSLFTNPKSHIRVNFGGPFIGIFYDKVEYFMAILCNL
jgi:hypothetical protein